MDIKKLIERVKAVLLEPARTWEVIRDEPADAAGLFQGYLMPLAALPVLGNFVGQCLVGVRLPWLGHYRIGIMTGLVQAVVHYILLLAAVFVTGKAIALLAPTFGAARNDTAGLKVAAYAATPAMVGGALMILPPLAVLTVLMSLYGIYLLYLGLRTVVGSPPEKSVVYTVAVAGVVILVFVVVGAIDAAIA